MRKLIIAALVASSALIAPSAFAQDQAQTDEVAALRAQVAALQAQLDALTARIDGVQQQADTTQAAVAAVAANPAPAAASAAAPAPPPFTVAFRAAPEITAPGGWSFKPRGRLQIDAGILDAPPGITDNSVGFSSEVRRAYLGMEGKMPGGFGYRAEVELANSAVEITDLYLTYQATPQLVVTMGQTKPFWGLEEMTSDLFTTFQERAAVNTAFGFERRLGLSATYSRGPVLVQAGVFTDNAGDLNNDEDNSISLDARAVVAPRVAGGTLHLGGSVHIRNLNDSGTSVRYRVRPFLHTADIRFVDTGAIAAVGENGYGLEAAYIRGPFHIAGEYYWQDVRGGPTGADATFSGGYVEAGIFLIPGDTRGYRGGAFERVRPRSSVADGGPGAIQLNVRYDTVDLTDGTIRGGTQDGYSASLIWTPTDYTRFMLNYDHLDYDNAFLALPGADRSYNAEAFGVRGQFDF